MDGNMFRELFDGLMFDGCSDMKCSYGFREVLTVFIRFSLIS